MMSKILSTILLLFTSVLTQAEQVLDSYPVDQLHKRVEITPVLQFIYDPEKAIGLEDIISDLVNSGEAAGAGKEGLHWSPASQLMTPLPLSSGHYWIKGTLSNNSDRPTRVTVQVEYPSINSIDMTVFSEAGSAEIIYREAGLDSRFDNRPLPHRTFLNIVEIPARSHSTLIWSVNSQPTLQFRASIWRPAFFFQRDQQQQVLYGMLYGTLWLMALYNFLLFYSTREKSYLYYVFYVITASYLLAADHGHIYQYIATGQSWIKTQIYAVVQGINLLLFGNFCISFLNLERNFPRLQYTIQTSAVASLLAIGLMALWGGKLFSSLYLVAVVVLFGSALIAGVRQRVRGLNSAGPFAIAILMMAAALTAGKMATMGLIAHNGFTDSLPAIGTTLMLIFFSLALADRINQLQRENSEAELAVIKAVEDTVKTRSELSKSQTIRIALEQSASDAKQESQLKSEFLATMSHEIRLPMDDILSKAQQMKSTHLDHKQTRCLNALEHSGDEMLLVIDDLEDFAKIEAGQMGLEYSHFNLETLIDDCISTFALRSVEKNIHFIADLDPNIEPILNGDVRKLRQIILNLLSNAFKFTERGDILISITKTEKRAVNSMEIKFEVRDSGIGLSEKQQQQLFSPFQHAVDNSYGGSGLGLSISKRLAQLMDGSIGVSSEQGKGSRFWFTARLLTVKDPDEKLIRKKSPLLADKNLLLVDPSPDSTRVISRLLRAWGMNVDTAVSVHEAMQCVKLASEGNNPYQVILSEYKLPDDDVLSLATKLHAATNQSFSLVLMAASRQLSRQSELRNCGIELMLEKPITTALLHDVIKDALGISTSDSPDELIIADSNFSVLIVEDNQITQLVLKGMMNKLNIKPMIAVNGLQALQYFEEQKFDLIIMDCEMPEMDGYEAARQIRIREQISDRQRTQIVALSAHARSDYQQRAQEAGMDNYLTKPVTLSALSTLIRR